MRRIAQILVVMGLANGAALAVWSLPDWGAVGWLVGVFLLVTGGIVASLWWLAVPLAGVVGAVVAGIEFVETMQARARGCSPTDCENWSDLIALAYALLPMAVTGLGHLFKWGASRWRLTAVAKS